jgi:two-component system LytT family response regulator
MPKIKSIIIDDEINNIDVLQKTLHLYCPNVQVIGTANNIKTGEELIHATNPQIVFLDVEMPYGNGFDLLAKLMPIAFEVVFVTAFNQYAVQAFKFSAIDYLLKPIDPSELIFAVQKVADKLETTTIDKRVEILLNNMKTDTIGRKKIAFYSMDAMVFEEIDNIMHLQAEGNYTHIYFKNKKREMITKKIGEFEDLLPSQIFCRVHNSHIININHIKKYHKGRGGYVEMDDDITVEISQRKKDEFLLLIKGS